MTEAWKTIKAAPSYEVSDLGNFRRSVPGKSTWVGRPCSLWIRSGDPYRWVSLSRGAKGSELIIRAHVVVATEFCGHRPTDNHVVAHNDGDTLNNAAVNLRWATHAENMADASYLIHGTSDRGEGHYLSVLSDDRVRILRAARASGESVSSFAKQWGVHRQTVIEAAAGRTWKHVQ